MQTDTLARKGMRRSRRLALLGAGSLALISVGVIGAVRAQHEGQPAAAAAAQPEAPAAAPAAPVANEAPAAAPAEGAAAPAATAAPAEGAPGEAAAQPAAQPGEGHAATGEHAPPTAQERVHTQAVTPPGEAAEAGPHGTAAEHEGAHGAAAGHSGGHGEGHAAGHGGPVIENWWSWDYGPGKAHHNPPFGFALLNFVVFLFILNRLAGKSLREFIANRHGEVRKALDRARTLEQKAQAQLSEYEKRTQAVEAEVGEMLATLRKQSEAERERIIAQAETEASKLLKDAESQVKVAIEAAKRELEKQAGLLAVEMAERLIRQQINDADQRALTERFVAQVESLSKSTAPGPTVGGAAGGAS
jgi:ATP synthase F0 subunit b